ncbi:Uncharacterised protein [Mycobacterium tuberculosis]|uniref:Uncharacterized protein n=1 Tax=Mycobacterium tuberculosis TaxID=1773 RepID=A0A654TEK3_MYCTX|nr:Uncharacterised protein [Mycobacterium tuberculosis]CFR64829.1 Uncharacterised protein [Mycobacterium tuberculosis]CFR74883.1 Uncharacterised protein [Mycobacterium tuberculosis]CFS28227.1 Uncharacterised protein [Mycobacterium tuberculosis]CKP63072.1 Uncharacterised protein [Mycobacterium tuberculosis]
MISFISSVSPTMRWVVLAISAIKLCIRVNTAIVVAISSACFSMSFARSRWYFMVCS